MMQNQRLPDTPSPKEIAVFEAVSRLLDEGREFYELKVSEIAAEAGIGKGTVYEYFPSKEDILERAVAYRFGQGFAAARACFERNLGFDVTLLALLDGAARAFARAGAGTFPLVNAILHSHPGGLSGRPCALVLQYMDSLSELSDRLTALGRAEGIVREGLEPDYLRFVFSGALAAYVQRVKCDDSPSGVETAKRYAVELFRRAVG